MLTGLYRKHSTSLYSVYTQVYAYPLTTHVRIHFNLIVSCITWNKYYVSNVHVQVLLTLEQLPQINIRRMHLIIIIKKNYFPLYLEFEKSESIFKIIKISRETEQLCSIQPLKDPHRASAHCVQDLFL